MSTRPHRLLLVCSGNLCRSPMAAALAQAHADRVGVEVEILSAGTLGLVDRPANAKAVGVCREIGLELGAHRSRALTPELVQWADRVLVMELGHAVWIRAAVEDLPEDKVMLLGGFAGLGDIADPIGSWFWGPFRTARDEIDRCVRAYFDRLVR